MAFIRFTQSGRSFAAKASISRTGMLSLNDGARRRFGIDRFKYCVLYYDPDTRRVGMEFTDDAEAEGVRKVRLRKTGADVAARSFVDFFDLGIRETTAFPVERDEGTGYLVIDLAQGTERVTRASPESATDN